MRRICGVLISVGLLVVTATPLAARSYVINPTLVQFTPSPDHAVVLPNSQPMVERYEIRFFAQGAAAPFQSASLGKPNHPALYASSILKGKILRYESRCWLIDTGWVGGAYGVGKRISIQYTRALLTAALSGKLEHVPYTRDPVFGFQVPQSCPGVPDQVLNPAAAWPSYESSIKRYRSLAARFIDNFKKFSDEASPEILAAGPVLSDLTTDKIALQSPGK